MRAGTVGLAAATWLVVAGLGDATEGADAEPSVVSGVRDFSVLAQRDLSQEADPGAEPRTCAPALPVAPRGVRGLPTLFARHGGLPSRPEV